MKVCIVGLGYVGLPLMECFWRNEIDICGVDVNKNRIAQLKECIDINDEVDKDFLSSCANKFYASLSKDTNADIYIITAPTPIDSSKKPNLEILIQATSDVGNVLKEGNTVIFESTVFPGTTDEICVPLLEKISNLKINEHFYVGYSPERVAPGRESKNVSEITKIVSGSCERGVEIVNNLYLKAIKAGTHIAPSIKVAEAAKITENIQRDVNIALMNELYQTYEKMNIKLNEVIDAASTKWNFHKYSQGMVGGHCIGVDPYYLIYKSKEKGHFLKLIDTARQINEEMVEYLERKILESIRYKELKKHKYQILVVGATFKEDCPDTRNSKPIELIERLRKKVNVDVFDPISVGYPGCSYRNLKEVPHNSYDCVFIAVGHQEVKLKSKKYFNKFLKSDGEIIDYKGILDD